MKPEVEYSGFMKQQAIEYGRIFRNAGIKRNSDEAVVFIYKNGERIRKYTEAKMKEIKK